ncbi:MAG: sigma 54-interacting transcriptional regulator [Deltaproteobacteria bacterium]|mgnify:CR=1 FL=1
MTIDGELAELVFEQIHGVIIVDTNARILYINKQWADLIGVDRSESVGKLVKEVLPPTKMDIIVQTGKPMNSDLFELKGHTYVCKRVPLFKDGQLIGAFSYEIFENMEIADEFIKKINKLSDELNYYKDEVRKMRRANYSIDNIKGESKAIKHLKKQIYNAAASNSTVIIQGETGTGKELVAHSIHDLSTRNMNNFIKLNCAAIPNELIESELFGYEEGSFTGAKKGGKQGIFELAHMGSLFLDEICDLPLAAQAKLLRVLQEKEVNRVGGHRSVPVDVRIITATNQDMEKMVEEKKFREDLYYRLHVIQILVPPLRERKEDIGPLCRGIIDNLNYTLNMRVKNISEQAIDMLRQHDWPGNIRELQNVIERAMNKVNYNDTLEEWHFNEFREKFLNRGLAKSGKRSGKNLRFLENVITQTERETILRTLKLHEGNKTKTAAHLNISRPLLYQKIKRLGIKL